MNNEMYIFVASNNPKSVNLYVNIVSHAVNYLNVDKLHFIKITNCESLNDAGVSDFINEAVNERIIQNNRTNPETYKKVYDVFTNNKKVVPWDYLLIKQHLKELKKNSVNPCFDLSSLPKRICLDFFTQLIFEGLDNIFIFEIKDTAKFNRPYHELLPTDYDVIKILNESVFMYTLEKYTKKQNRDKMAIVFCSLMVSAILIYIFPPTDLSFVNVSMIFLTLLSGLIPLLELAGFINLSKLWKK